MLIYILLGMIGVLASTNLFLWKYSSNVKADVKLLKANLEILQKEKLKERNILNAQIKTLGNAIANPNNDSDTLDRLRKGQF